MRRIKVPVNKLRSTDAFLICHNGPCAGDFFKQWEDVRLVTKSSGVCVSGSVFDIGHSEPRQFSLTRALNSARSGNQNAARNAKCPSSIKRTWETRRKENPR